MKNRLIVFLFLSFSFLNLQANVIDSLKSRLAEVDVEEKIPILNKLSKQYLTISIDTSKLYATQAIKLAEEIGDGVLLANSILQLGDAYYLQGENDEALSIFNKALEVLGDKDYSVYVRIIHSKGNALTYSGEYNEALANFQLVLDYKIEIQDTLGMAGMYNNIGITYFYLGEYQKAVEIYQKAIEIYEALQKRYSVANLLSNISLVYNEMDDFDKAVEFSQKALKVFYDLEKYFDQVSTLANLGNMYKSMGEYDKCIDYCTQALEIAEGRGFKILEGIAMVNMGLGYEGLEEYDMAMEYIMKAISIDRELSQTPYIIKDLRNIGRIYKKIGQYDLALISLDESEDLANNIGAIVELYETHKEISDVYALQGNYKKAYEYHLLYTELKDSIFTEEKHKQINELQTKYETEKKERENIELTQEVNMQKLKNLKNRYYILGLSIAAALILFISLLLIRQNKMRGRQRAIELEQKLFRSQMNPHFIFNAISSIQNYIVKNQPIEAGAYLADFARLMRLIMENSREEYISLQQETDTMKYYLEMQKLRFEDGFKYEIVIDEVFDLEDILVPPMLAQPFAENSIEHGFKGRNENNELFIRYLSQNGFVHIEVEDNGQGRIRAASSSSQDHKSFAVEVTQSRLERLNRKSRSKYDFTIQDLVSDLNEPCGTKVQFKVPLVQESL